MTKGPWKRSFFGLSLVELIVSMAVFSLMALSATLTVTRGLEFFTDSNTALEVRQQALVGISRMTRDLKETHVGSTHIETADAIVFPSIRDLVNRTTMTGDGKIVWNSVICYFVATDGTEKKLYRHQQILAPSVPPLVRPPDPYGLTPALNVAYFTGLPGPRMVCRRVQGCKFSTSFLDPTTGITRSDSVKIELTCNLSERHEYTTTLRTQVVPRMR